MDWNFNARQEKGGSMKFAKLSCVLLILCCLVFPVSGYSQESPKPNPGPWFGAAVVLTLTGLLALNSANSYEEKYDDPFKYDQEEAKSNANNLRTLAYVEFGGAAICALVGINKLQVTPMTTVGLGTDGKFTMLLARHEF